MSRKRQRSPGAFVYRESIVRKPAPTTSNVSNSASTNSSSNSSSQDNHIHVDYVEASQSRVRYIPSVSYAPLLPPRPSSPFTPDTSPSFDHGSYSAKLAGDDENSSSLYYSYSFTSPDIEGNPDVPEPEEQSSVNEQGSTVKRAPELQIFRPYRDSYIQTMLWNQGRGDNIDQKSCSCGRDFDSIAGNNRAHRCRTCRDFTQLFCEDCLIDKHQALPFHFVEQWNGTFFERVSLQSLGYEYHLGRHSPKTRCILKLMEEFVILDVNGFHVVDINICQCVDRVSLQEQLLRARLFPATVANPRTAATFEVLEHFQMMNFMSKVSAQEYYQTLERLTDNSGTQVPSSRLQEWRRMIREFRTLRLNKRLGFGHKPEGVDSARPGELAVKCPACPWPGVNLPEDWQRAPLEKRFIYKLFTAMDGNRKLCRLNVSSTSRDPGFNRGCAYFNNDVAFRAHVAAFDKKFPNERSTCNDHKAVNNGTMLREQHLASSGAISVFCARHDTFRPIGTTDQRIAERQVDIDFALLNTLQFNTPDLITSSFDVMCQYSIKFFKRIAAYPEQLCPRQPRSAFQFLVPKFHLNAHVSFCRVNYSFNWAPRVGRTDGEGPERGWSAENALAGSTKKMTPGGRWDTVDDHFGDWNWLKSITLAPYLASRAAAAVEKRPKHVLAYLGMCAIIGSDRVMTWIKEVEDWEAGVSETNPFVPTVEALTYNQVRHSLAKEEEARVKSQGAGGIVDTAISPMQVIVQGLELEESQRRLKWDTLHLGEHPTDLQKAKLAERGANLRRRLSRWFESQTLHIPAACVLRNRQSEKATLGSGAAFDIPLYLPSQVYGEGGSCEVHLLQMEFRLRFAHCLDALETLRKYLLSRTAILQFKLDYTHGQYQGTKSAHALASVSSKIGACAARYRLHYVMLSKFAEQIGVARLSDIFKPLTDSDIRGIEKDSMDADLEDELSLSWIWESTGLNPTDSVSIADSLRINWCKARARAHRWQEECLFLQEEMRRSQAFMESEAREWEKRAATTGFSEDERLTAEGREVEARKNVEGRAAYAHRQAAIRRKMASHYEKRWAEILPKLGSGEGGIRLDSDEWALV